MILSRAWLHDTVSCAAWNDARKGVYLKPLFKTPCSSCYWGWRIPIMLDYRDISLMESVPLMWGPVTASPMGIEPMIILDFRGGGPPYNWYPIHDGENSTFSPGWPPNTPYDCAEARRTQVADATFRDNYNSTTLHYNYNYNCTIHTTSSSSGWGDHCNHCNHSKKHNSNHLSVHQSIRSAINASQQLTFCRVFYLWNFRRRLARYYW